MGGIVGRRVRNSTHQGRPASGENGRIDLSEAIRSTRAPAKLREPAVFRKVKPSGHGFGVAWPDGVEIGADTLYWLYRRQNGLRDAADELHTWRISHGLPLDMAAEEIGVSRRMLSYYEARKWPVPKTVVLALAGWEAQRPVGVQEHFRRRGERPRHGERHHRPGADRRRVAQAALGAGLAAIDEHHLPAPRGERVRDVRADDASADDGDHGRYFTR